MHETDVRNNMSAVAKLSACLNPETVGCQSAGDREQKTLIQVLFV